MTEIWKDIKGYETLFKVSNFGRIKSLKREVKFGLITRVVEERILKSRTSKNGYNQISLLKDGKLKTFYIHRLVAQAFIPNPNNLPQVNHKDEDKTNNNVVNLEWCDNEYNINYGTTKKRISKSRSIPVIQLTLDGELVRLWESAKETAKEGFYPTSVTKCCKKHKGYYTTGGYKWKYYDKETYLIGIMNNNIKKGAA